jgi:hypothetical protein
MILHRPTQIQQKILVRCRDLHVLKFQQPQGGGMSQGQQGLSRNNVDMKSGRRLNVKLLDGCIADSLEESQDIFFFIHLHEKIGAQLNGSDVVAKSQSGQKGIQFVLDVIVSGQGNFLWRRRALKLLSDGLQMSAAATSIHHPSGSCRVWNVGGKTNDNNDPL